MSVAFGCLAGVIFLYIQQFLHNDMMPKLKSSNKLATDKDTDKFSINYWSGFEDELLNKVQEKLYEWGSVYGVSKLDSRIRIDSLIYYYNKSGCKKLFCKSVRPIENEVFLHEENFRKYANFCEPVTMWLCSPIQFTLHGFLEGLLNKILEQILENDAKGWKDYI